ncbi:MAG: OmpA family protein [Burkholderiales bacterium]|nr:OmpA family protein [Burkholderiales bacterium]
MTLRHRTKAALGLAAALALLSGCSSPVKLDQQPPAPVESRPADGGASVPAAGAGAASAGAPQSQVATVDLERQRAEREAGELAAKLPRTFYFDFDSYVVRPEYRDAVEGYSRMMKALREHRLALEGHADERGGREYNLALGQKRAEAVARALELLGVEAGRIEAVSFGEERPADPRSSEEGWAKNRRVEIRDR